MDAFKVVGIGIILAATCVELPVIISYTRDKNLVRDAKSNILLGIVYFLTDLLVKTIVFGVFSLCYQYSVFKPELSWWLWVVGFVACDFMHYIYHLLGHTTRILWAAHVTHHSSEYFNMSHGYRINFFQRFHRFLFGRQYAFWGSHHSCCSSIILFHPSKTFWFTPKKSENLVFWTGYSIPLLTTGSITVPTRNTLIKIWARC